VNDWELKKKGDLYYRRDPSGKLRFYALKECLVCHEVTFIRHPDGRFCSRSCSGLSLTMKDRPAPKREKPPKVDYILALDPGGARCGYALYEHEYGAKDSVLIRSGIVTYESLTDFLQTMTYTTQVVCESYIIRPGLNHGSSGKTIKAIGQIEMWAKSLGIPLALQRPDILVIAHKITGIPKPKGHLPDDKSAILHGAYWLAGKKWYLNVLERGKKAS